MTTRGTIETVGNDWVSGWISSTERSMKGARVLAFLGTDCIGGAEVDVFRPDIQDAQLGDGHAGFVIHTMPIDPAREGQVYVRLEGEDPILVTPRFHQAKPVAAAPLTRAGLNDELQSIRWMRERGWLGQAEADMLRTLVRFGVYELRMTAGDEPSPMEQARKALAGLLSLWERRDMAVEPLFCADEEALAEALKEQRERPATRYIALWSVDRNRVSVAEGSQVEEPDAKGARHVDGVGYEYGGAQMLVLHPRVTLMTPRPISQTILLHAA